MFQPYENPDGASAPDLDPTLLSQWWDGELSRAEADVLQVLISPSTTTSSETEEDNTSCQS
jgi:hypothetical protein